MQGVLKVLEPEEAEAHEHEHEKGEEEEVEEGHVCPTPTYFLDPMGVEIMSAKDKA